MLDQIEFFVIVKLKMTKSDSDDLRKRVIEYLDGKNG